MISVFGLSQVLVAVLENATDQVQKYMMKLVISDQIQYAALN